MEDNFMYGFDLAAECAHHNVIGRSQVSDLGAARGVLSRAADLISGDRKANYGEAGESLGRIAKLWSVELGIDVRPDQVARLMALLKIARLNASPCHLDSSIDAAGYIALAAELAAKSLP